MGGFRAVCDITALVVLLSSLGFRLIVEEDNGTIPSRYPRVLVVKDDNKVICRSSCAENIWELMFDYLNPKYGRDTKSAKDARNYNLGRFLVENRAVQPK